MNLNMGLLGRKIGMTQIYDQDGTAVPVTAIDAGPCTVLQIRTEKNEGYSALQLGFDPKPGRNVSEELLKRAQGARARYELEHGRTSKPMRGHFFKVGEAAPQRFVREIRVSSENAAEFEAGQQVTTEMFEKGNFVDVVGTSKGRGFTGVIKRHGFSMFPKTHGTHEWRRHGGSIGCRKPMRTRRGQRMAGQHGNARITVQNLKVAGVLPEQNVLLIRGAVPGPNGGYLVIRKAIKKS
ncbi:MAG: 50S ribosomal protein L3 [Planctomycetota bacterium]|jgi:large subunit ribosomal protein L3